MAYITGDTKEIGCGVAQVLINQGMKVAISGRKAEDAKKAAASLGGSDVVLGFGSEVVVFASGHSFLVAINPHDGHYEWIYHVETNKNIDSPKFYNNKMFLLDTGKHYIFM